MKYNQLEVVIRIKSPTGGLLAEHIIRGQHVELLEYFPSGKIHHKANVSLEDFIVEVEKLQDRPYLEPNAN